MTIFDLILLIILSGFTLFGFWFGLVHTLGALAGVLVGATVASRYYVFVADFVHNITGGSENAVKVLSFIVLFILINRLVGFVFYLLDEAFGIVKIIPFLSGINRLLGAVIGFIEGALIIGMSLYFASIHPFSLWLSEMILEKSEVAKYFLGVAAILLPLIPDAVKELQARLPDLKT